MDGFKGELETVHQEEPVKGYRCWKFGYTYEEEPPELITYMEPRLVSVAVNPSNIEETAWQPAVKAVSIHLNSGVPDESHTSPKADCECGFWAFKTGVELAGQYGTHPYLFGRINMWGHVIQGKRGYRSAYAYPDKIWVPAIVKQLWEETLGGGRDVARELRDMYKVEVEVLETNNFTGNEA